MPEFLTQQEIESLLNHASGNQSAEKTNQEKTGIHTTNREHLFDNFSTNVFKLGMDKIDPVTGCKAAYAFESDFAILLRESEQKLCDLTLAIVGIDNLTRINDEYGQATGDRVLNETADVLDKIESSRVYRYVGDSFAVVFPRCEKEQAFLRMEEARKALAETEVYKKYALTVSAGIATYPEDGHRQTDILRKVNGALYRAKDSGRNKICLAKEEKLVTKTAHYTVEQLKRLKDLSEKTKIGEAELMREALDRLLQRYERHNSPHYQNRTLSQEEIDELIARINNES